jgi:amino acid adenylation domain-containing protein
MSRHVLHQLFELADKFPDHIVIEHDSARISAGDLVVRTAQVADVVLAAIGDEKEALIAVLLPPGIDRVVAMLGVWAAGAVYVPLDSDPAAPPQRLNAILKAARPRLLILDSQNSTHLATTEWPNIKRISMENLVSEAQRPTPVLELSTLAYVVFTSGSTGAPKGVALEHGTLARLLDAVLPRLGSGRRTLQLAPGTFDMSMKEVLATLIGGGTLIIDSGVDLRNPESVLSGLQSADADLIFVTPTGLHGLRMLPEFDAFLNLRHSLLAVCGGEQLALDRAITSSNLIVDNHYGPTESHVVTAHRVDRDEHGHVPIGVSLHGSSIYLLDPAMQPVGPGLVGEIWIGGQGLARCYVGRPDLTAERFLPDPYSDVPGSRMYRTGDLARYGTNGEYSMVGRVDDQVKVRGYRVEPGEVRTALLTHPGIREAHVAGRELGNSGIMSLVAWVQGDWSYDDNLRGFLSRSLPHYMVPGHFIWVDNFPMTRNGKVDSQRLPLPTGRRPASGNAFAEPRNELERDLASLWASELGLSEVGRDDNFFDLGGYSLQAVRLVFRMRNELGIEIPVHALYEAPTIAMLAQHSAVAVPSEIPIVDRDTALHPLSYGQARMWLHQRSHPESSIYNVPLLMRISGPFDTERFARALAVVSSRVEVLRTLVETTAEGTPAQRVDDGASISLTEITAVGDTREERFSYAVSVGETAASIPFDLALAPSLKAYSMTIDQDDHVLILVAHHILLDGWSADVFAREVSSIYAALDSGRSLPPPQTIQYIDFASWQRGRVAANPAGLDYWRRQLSEVWRDPLIEHSGHGVHEAHGHQEVFEIERSRADRLARIASENGTTDFVLALTLFQRALSLWSDNEDIRIGVPVSGRTHAETARMIGYFSNTVVMRSRVSRMAPFRELLEAAKLTVNEAFLHQEVPFDLVVEACRPPRDDWNEGRLFQASMAFAHGGHQPAEWNLGGGNPEFIAIRPRGTQFPITLFVEWDSHGRDVKLRFLWNERVVSYGEVARLKQFMLAAVDEALNEPQALASIEDLPPKSIVEAFYRAARDWPGREFLLDESGLSLSYAAAQRRIEDIARGLVSAGILPGDAVVVELPRGIEHTLALLAIMRARGVYVPIEAQQPPSRRESMIRHVSARAVIGDGSAPVGGVLDLHLDKLSDTVSALPPMPYHSDIAYALFTSGSTGLPKPVNIEHGGLASLVEAQRILAVKPGSRVLGFSAPVFDAAIWELVLAIGVGGAVVLASATTRLDANELDRLMIDARVDLALLTPTVIRRLAPLTQWRGILISGGEALDKGLVIELLQFVERGSLWNAYGPTEATVVCTLHHVSAADVAPDAPLNVPIGMPIHGVNIHLVDDRGARVGAGIPGELVISGSQVARSYWGMPGLTADRFVPAENGSRSYRTGDRAVLNSNAQLEYLGRMDDQIKMNGQRIEPGEIENVLRGHHGVKDVAAAVVSRASGDKLVLWYVPADDGVRQGELVEELHHNLPARLRPSELIALPVLPLTTSGKVDRKALALSGSCGATRPESLQPYAAPSRDVEDYEVIRAAWSSILGVPVGVDDNLFDLGGTSLDTVLLASATSSALRSTVSVRELFEGQTPRKVQNVIYSRKPASTLGDTASLASNASVRVAFVPPLSGSFRPYSTLIANLLTQSRQDLDVLEIDLRSYRAGTLREAATSIADDLMRGDGGTPIWLIGWSLAAPLAHEIAAQLSKQGIRAGAIAIDSYMPGSLEYELGAHDLARRIETLKPTMLDSPPPWLRQAGLSLRDLDAIPLKEWDLHVGGWAWRVKSVGSHLAPSSLGDCLVILATRSKSAEELNLMERRWRRANPSAIFCRVNAGHDELLVEQAPSVAALILTQLSSSHTPENKAHLTGRVNQ